MLTGAFFGIWADAWSGSWVVGLLFAMLTGGLLALVHAFFAINLRADQIVSGTAINFLALGITGYVFIVDLRRQRHAREHLEHPRRDHLDLGELLRARLRPAQPDDLALDPARDRDLACVVFRTPIGLRIRAVGEHPRAADTAGISVFGIRYAVRHALGRARGARRRLPLDRLRPLVQPEHDRGRGFIALAALIFGKWRPFGAFAAALLFGFSSALADRLPDCVRDRFGHPFNAFPTSSR